ncbi:unnamed protein product, partial [Symbiodinium sp. KB8]
PLVWPLDFEERRSCEGAEVLEPDSTRDSLPVALQKRYVMGPTELDFLVKESLKSVQLPYRLDEDEEKAYHKIMNEVVFLLGRSGSGKTSVLVHALFRASCEEFQKRVGVLAASTMGVFMEFYRRENREASIPRQLFPQPTGSSKQPGIELGVVREEVCGVLIAQLKSLIEADSSGAGKKCDLANQERKQFRPPPSSIWVLEYHCIQSSDFQIRVITNWNALLRMLDNSVKGDNTMAARGGAFLQAVEEAEPYSGLAFPFLPARDTFTQGPSRCQEERFDMPEEGGGGGLFDQDRYDEFEQLMGGKLMGQHLDKSKGDTLFGAYREFLTVIAGSPRAARSRDGTLSREEYVSDRDAQGKPIPELRESAYRSGEGCAASTRQVIIGINYHATRNRIYSAFEAGPLEYAKPSDWTVKLFMYPVWLGMAVASSIGWYRKCLDVTGHLKPLLKPQTSMLRFFAAADGTDAARNILRRAEKEGMKDPVRKCRPQVLSMGG